MSPLIGEAQRQGFCIFSKETSLQEWQTTFVQLQAIEYSFFSVTIQKEILD
jgi:hypothetical protein